MRRYALSLIELLVVIAIVAILIALLLPAIQKVRQAAARIQCASHLKQLALACQSFHDARKQLPTGQYGDYDAPTAYGGPFENSMSWSWMADLLPYVEQTGVHKSGGIPDAPLDGNAALAANIPVFFCPSDLAVSNSPYPELTHYMRTAPRAGLTNYKGVMGSNFCWGPWTNPGVSGDCEPWQHGDGVIFPMVWQRPRRLPAIPDGTSNTFLIGENIWQPENPGPNRYGLGSGWAHSVHVARTCAIPPNAKMPDGSDVPATASFDYLMGFRSRHLGGVQFAYLDGSVQFVTDSIPLGLYRSLATIAGGEVASVP